MHRIVDDPARTLDRIIYEMRFQLVEAKKQVAVAIADEHRLRREGKLHMQRGIAS